MKVPGAATGDIAGGLRESGSRAARMVSDQSVQFGGYSRDSFLRALLDRDVGLILRRLILREQMRIPLRLLSVPGKMRKIRLLKKCERSEDRKIEKDLGKIRVR